MARNSSEDERVRYLALGDSYTIGECVTEIERWPNQLAELMRRGAITVDPPMIFARTGWTTGELLEEICLDTPSEDFHLVSLLIGVNNQYRGIRRLTYRDELAELLALSTRFAGGRAARVLVLSIPDWSVTPFADGRDREQIATEIARFNAIKRQEAETHGCRFVDVTPISRLAGSDESLLASDGLHPSGKMYAQWARLALPEARQAVG